MSNINPTYNDRVEYELYNKNQGSLSGIMPIGWQSDEKEYARHETYHGIVSRFSNSLKFTDAGKDFIQLIERSSPCFCNSYKESDNFLALSKASLAALSCSA